MEDPETGELELLYEAQPKQAEFHAAQEPNVLYVGSRGTGKSHALRWEAHARAMAYPGFKYAILRRTYPELYKTHLTFIEKEMRKLGGTWHATNKMAKYANGSIGFYSQCESEADVLNLLGAELYWIGFDEMSTFPWEWIVKLSVSVRVPTDSGLIAMVRGATNPLGESAGDLNRYYVTKDVDPTEDSDYNPEDYRAIFTKMGDNRHVDVEQYRKRFAGLPEHVRAAWLDGEFIAERTLFRVKKFKDDKPWHVIKELPTWRDGSSLLAQPWVKVYRAYDDGFFPDPAVCLWFMVIGRRIIVFKEKVWIQKTVKDIAADIKRESQGMNIVMTYCDPKMDVKTTSDVETIRDKFEAAGIPMEPSVNDREWFAKAINEALTEEVDGLPRLQMYAYGPDGCPYLVKYLPEMRWKETNFKAMDDHKHDHPVVALAYFLMSYIPNTQPNEIVTVPYMMRRMKKKREALGSKQVRRY